MSKWADEHPNSVRRFVPLILRVKHGEIPIQLVVSTPLKNMKVSWDDYSHIWVCLKIVYPYTQWFCWSLSLWKMAISLGIYTIFRPTHMWKNKKCSKPPTSHIDPLFLWKIPRVETNTCGPMSLGPKQGEPPLVKIGGTIKAIFAVYPHFFRQAHLRIWVIKTLVSRVFTSK